MNDEEQSKPIPMNKEQVDLFEKLMIELAKMGVIRAGDDGEIEYHPESYPGQI